MAKMNGTFRIISIIGLVLTLSGLLFAAGIQWGQVKDLKVEGCNPAQLHTTQIAVIESRLDTIVEQNTAILKKLNE